MAPYFNIGCATDAAGTSSNGLDAGGAASAARSAGGGGTATPLLFVTCFPESAIAILSRRGTVVSES